MGRELENREDQRDFQKKEAQLAKLAAEDK
jgi:hypothetical protein